jgi:hypothetical protein
LLRVKDEKAPKKALKGHIEGSRVVGRLRRRWIDVVERDDRVCKSARIEIRRRIEMLGGGGLKKSTPV